MAKTRSGVMRMSKSTVGIGRRVTRERERENEKERERERKKRKCKTFRGEREIQNPKSSFSTIAAAAGSDVGNNPQVSNALLTRAWPGAVPKRRISINGKKKMVSPPKGNLPRRRNREIGER